MQLHNDHMGMDMPQDVGNASDDTRPFLTPHPADTQGMFWELILLHSVLEGGLMVVHPKECQGQYHCLMNLYAKDILRLL